jgi:hypothetical protein
MDWYASDNNLCGILQGSLKKPNVARLPTCCLRRADANSHVACHAHAAPIPQCAMASRNRFQNSMVMARHGHCMACVNQIWPHRVNQMGKTKSKPLAARHGRGTAQARHGNNMVCVNWPFKFGLLKTVSLADT